MVASQTTVLFLLIIVTVLLIQLVNCASVYSNIDIFSNPNFEPICSHQTERFIESEGKESSLLLELHPGLMTHGSCKRILTAPESHGFVVRLVRPKFRKSQSSGPSAKNLHEMSPKISNSTRSCPLSIFSSNDRVNPSWRIDPCQLEISAEQEDPVRLFQGRLRIIWDHGGNKLASKLMVTVLGKGIACQQNNKHPCLKFGPEALLCISKDLVCDGIRHCPNSNEYDSDEDYEMCSKRRKLDGKTDTDVWEHLTIEIFRNLFTSDSSLSPTLSPTSPPTKPTLMTKVDSKTNLEGNSSESIENGVKRNSTRASITSDLSKYGPWGYLMLGMLLCGGALLICGLWASTASNNQNEAESSSHTNTAIDYSPPNYEDLDPPPAYAALFPHQKSSSEPVASSSANTEQTQTSAS